MASLMEKPHYHSSLWWGRGLADCYCRRNVSSEFVRDMFFNQGIYNENNIPNELKEDNWYPDNNKRYNIWWYNNADGDISNTGENILFYIEEYC